MSTTPIYYLCAPCTLGSLLAAGSANGLRAVMLGDNAEAMISTLRQSYPHAQPAPPHADVQRWSMVLHAYLRGQHPMLHLPLDIGGTEFQRRVWAALQSVPYGSTITYRQLAEALGQPTAARAVGNACAANPVALVIPCHRAVASDGSLNGYRWGLARKAALLDLERFGEHSLANAAHS